MRISTWKHVSGFAREYIEFSVKKSIHIEWILYFLNVQIVLKNLQPIQQLAGKLPASRHKAKLICSEISRLTRANFRPLDSSSGLRKPNFPKLFELLSHRKASMKCVLRSSFGNPSTLLSLFAYLLIIHLQMQNNGNSSQLEGV